MDSDRAKLYATICTALQDQVCAAGGLTSYREPLVGVADAGDPRFAGLGHLVPGHMQPADLLPGARSVVSFFLPFASGVIKANSEHRTEVARDWAVAYVETNALIGRITAHLGEMLGDRGIRTAAEPATHNFDTGRLVSRWSHKSVAVIAGLGSFGLHQMVITDAGCAGRFGSIVLDVPLPVVSEAPKERCWYLLDGSCLECVMRCPVGALDADAALDRHACYEQLLCVSREFADVGLADVCGKCAVGPCALEGAT